MTSPSRSVTLRASVMADPDIDLDANAAAASPASRLPAPVEAVAAPTDPLALAVAAMDRGNLVEAKRLATTLVRTSSEAEVRTRAENLLSQLAPDRVIVAVMLGSGLLAVLLYLAYRQ